MNPQQPNFDDFAKGLGANPDMEEQKTPLWSDRLSSIYNQNLATKPIDNLPTLHSLTNSIDPFKKAIDTDIADVSGSLQNNQNIQNSNDSLLNKLGSEISTGADIAGKVTSVPFNMLGNAINNIIPQQVKDAVGTPIQGIADSITSNPEALHALNTINDLVDKHPQIVQLLNGLGTTAFNVSGMGGGKEAAIVGKDALENSVVPAISNAADATKDAVKGAVDATADAVKRVTPNFGNGQNELERIAETITPKPTIKEAKLAMSEGRLYKGQEPSFLRSGTEDKVATTEQQANSARTIHRLIPDAAKMDEPTLYGALDEKVGELSQNLKPEMEKVPIKSETVKNITDEWNALKTEQRSNAYTPSDVNVKKLQADFESRLQKSKSGNMNDLWDTRKAYDESVPLNVRNANELSSESLQVKREIWLQNRRILSDAINDSRNGLGEVSQKAFLDMRDMYEAQNGIMSKAKIDTKIKPNKITQFVKKHPVVTGAATMGAVSATGIPGKAVKAISGL